MAAIYLEHPRHGQKVACTESEAKYDEEHGWKRLNVAALLRKAPVEAEVAEPVNALVKTAPDEDELVMLRVRSQQKFGTKPHHKKSAATLRAELES
jgi:hypothetical protein